MDKTAIKNFAIEARKILMRSAKVQAGFYGVTKDGCSEPVQKGAGFESYITVAGTENRIYDKDISKRRELVKAINEIGFEQVMEKSAYTWFNRLIAIRFMEVNDYLPTRTRVLSSLTGSKTPDILTDYLDVSLNLSEDELEKIQKAIKENKYDDAFGRVVGVSLLEATPAAISTRVCGVDLRILQALYSVPMEQASWFPGMR